jgi:hypothetical protein
MEEKLIRDFIGNRVYYDEHGGGYIWGKTKDQGSQMIAQVDSPQDDYVLSIRGWGAIQNMIKNQEDAEKFQDYLGEWIADAINQKLKNI